MKESSIDKQWAKAYILDPLTAPEPSQDTGIASSSKFHDRPKTASLSESRNDYWEHKSDHRENRGRHNQRHHHQRQRSQLTPPPSRLSAHSLNSPEQEPTPRVPSPDRSISQNCRYPPNTTVTRSASARAPHSAPERPEYRHQRSVSANTFSSNRSQITERFPGDMSHRPLEILRKEARTADRAPNLRRKNMPETDLIDSLDTIGGTYHHGGPYDAALASRNRNKKYSPVAAVQDSNMEALRATPREYIEDSLHKHVPLQGIAIIPPGAEDFRGNVMRYEEGADLMREPDAMGGAYKRWDGIKYHPDDLKGKGPNFELERDLKERDRKAKSRHSHGQAPEYELVSRPPLSNRHSHGERGSSYGVSNSAGVSRHNSTGKRLSDGLRRRLGSIRRKKPQAV